MKSLSLLVADSKRGDANALMWALGRQPDPSLPETVQTFSVDCSPSRAPVATHWGAHSYDDDLLAILESKILPPGIDWTAYGLTAISAQQALDAIKFSAHADRKARANFAALGEAHGVGRIR